jgi:hypothetical protein
MRRLRMCWGRWGLWRWDMRLLVWRMGTDGVKRKGKGGGRGEVADCDGGGEGERGSIGRPGDGAVYWEGFCFVGRCRCLGPLPIGADVEKLGESLSPLTGITVSHHDICRSQQQNSNKQVGNLAVQRRWLGTSWTICRTSVAFWHHDFQPIHGQ